MSTATANDASHSATVSYSAKENISTVSHLSEPTTNDGITSNISTKYTENLTQADINIFDTSIEKQIVNDTLITTEATTAMSEINDREELSNLSFESIDSRDSSKFITINNTSVSCSSKFSALKPQACEEIDTSICEPSVSQGNNIFNGNYIFLFW